MADYILQQKMFNNVASLLNALVARNINIPDAGEIIHTTINAISTNNFKDAIAELQDYLTQKALPPILAVPLCALAVKTDAQPRTINAYVNAVVKALLKGDYEKIIELTKEKMEVSV